LWEFGIAVWIDIDEPARAGILKGQLEYAFDVVPAWVLTQKTNTAYGGGSESVRVQVDIVGAEEGEAVF